VTHTWDIFCSVVDNFGDAGVCWRLARQLAKERGKQVRLWIDDTDSLDRLCHAVDASAPVQRVQKVEIRRWDGHADSPVPGVEVADIVIEGFGVRLPVDYVTAMAKRNPTPVWVNLEYLSAEDWVESHHGLPSPHPSLPLTRYFFFPGFTPATGGLLVEHGLAAARDAFQSDANAKAEFLRRLGIDGAGDSDLLVSLFSYENGALPALVDAWLTGPQRILCLVPEGRALAQLSELLQKQLAPGVIYVAGTLTIIAIPFLEQDDYDRLLWACDLNFVRGEDSFVRAQLAARPLVWQAYPQAEGAHLAKMRAFLDRYGAGLETDAAAALASMFGVWNTEGMPAGHAWQAFLRQLPLLGRHAGAWASSLFAGKSLAETLENFCENKLK
jgi:uncharacterized repeat protein (TIGR03837 family)